MSSFYHDIKFNFFFFFFFFDIILIHAKDSFAKNLFNSQEFMVYNLLCQFLLIYFMIKELLALNYS